MAAVIGRQAMVLPCQDIRLEHDGKLTLVGLFTGNIAIPTVPTIIAHLMFLIIIDGDLAEPLKTLRIEIRLPQAAEPAVADVPMPFQAPTLLEGQKRWRYQIPFAIAPAVLTPGRIVCKIVHDKGEIETGARWIVHAPLPTIASAQQTPELPQQ
ncbi:MAG TPA: hypothetical protein VMV19_02340 [Xanthobacteraceae bacterium]|nr:hypothetical protein [Xanthobacteraceae bacterium]